MPGVRATTINQGVEASVGQLVRALRRIRGITQPRLGWASRLSVQQIGKVERGDVSPTVHSLAQIAASLDVPVARLLVSAEVACRSLDDLVCYLQAKSPDEVAHILPIIRQSLDR